MRGKENTFISHGEHLFHENRIFQKEEVSLSTSNNKNSKNSNPHDIYKVFTGVKPGTRDTVWFKCSLEGKNCNGSLFTNGKTEARGG